MFVLAQHRHAPIGHLGVDQHIVRKSNDVIIRDDPVVGESNGLYGHFADRPAAEQHFATDDLPGSQVCHCRTSISGSIPPRRHTSAPALTTDLATPILAWFYPSLSAESQ